MALKGRCNKCGNKAVIAVYFIFAYAPTLACRRHVGELLRLHDAREWDDFEKRESGVLGRGGWKPVTDRPAEYYVNQAEFLNRDAH